MESSRLKQAHEQAIAEVNAQIQHWETVRSDYTNLSERISTLPDKTFHNVMVPFGSLAFMPGKIIHTNELMVHLGDSWFADVSCKQGLKIIDHRMIAVNKNADDLEKVLKNIEKKSEFTEELDNSGSEPSFEIKEEVPANYLHPGRRKRVSRIKPQSEDLNKKESIHSAKTGSEEAQTSVAPSASNSDAIKSCFDDEELMKRLDELEKEEEEQDQMLLTESDHAQTSQDRPSSSTSKKKVSWDKKVVEGREAYSDDSDDATSVVSTIRFHHSFSVQEHQNSPGKSNQDIITSPGDIGRVGPKNSSLKSGQNSYNEKGDSKVVEKMSTSNDHVGLKSIMKPSSAPKAYGDEMNEKNAVQKIQVAVAENVLERSQDFAKSQDKPVSKKPVSKFKASRKR